MDNTGRVPVCRGLVSEATQQHALKLDFRVAVDNFTLTDTLKELWRAFQPCMRIVVPRITARSILLYGHETAHHGVESFQRG